MYCIYIGILLALVSCECYRHRPHYRNISRQHGNKKHQFNKLPHAKPTAKFVKNIKEYPFMALIVRKNLDTETNKSMTQTCGATILNRQFLLTAANCFGDNNKKYPKEEYTVYAGGFSIKRATKTAKIKSYYVYPEYLSKDEKYKCFNQKDIAVVMLDKPLKYSKKVSFVKLPPTAFDNSTNGLTVMLQQQSCVVLGWDHKAIKSQPYHLFLKVANVKVINYEECASIYPVCQFTQICNKNPKNNKRTWQGNGGGPLLCDGVQVGITNWGGKGLPQKVGGVNTRVELFVQWINGIAFHDIA